MILLKKLQLNNFLSHENTKIEFEENENTLIDGSSGAGKSSIFDGILWCLYGQGRADNRTLVKKGAAKGSVCLELTRREEGKEDTVCITRTATSTGKHTLEVAIQQSDGVRTALPLSGVKEIQNWIDKDLIGASYTLFVNSVAYVQGNAESFVSQTAPKRKELLLEIVKAEDYDEYYEKARKTLSALDVERSGVYGQIIEMEARLGALTGSGGDREGLLEEIKQAGMEIERINPQLEQLEKEKSRISMIVQMIDALRENIRIEEREKEELESFLSTSLFKISFKGELEKQISLLSSHEKKIEESNIRLTNLRESLASASERDEERNKFYAKKPIVTNRDNEIKRFEEQVESFKKKEPCPSGDKCPYHSQILTSIDFAEKKIGELNKATQEEALLLANWFIEERKLPPANDIKAIIKDIGETEKTIKSLETELSKSLALQKDIDIISELEKVIPDQEERIRQKKLKIEKSISDKDSAEKDLSAENILSIDGKLSSFKEALRFLNNDIVKMEMEIKSIDQDKEEMKVLEERIKTTRISVLRGIEEKMRTISLVKDAFGSKGIKTIVIDYLLPKLEDRINEVLSKMSDFRVRLDTQKKSSDGESTIEGLFITILNEMSDELPFETYSGGEKLKISVAISESLATLQKVGFRLFDETFVGLDENSTESFARVLGSLQKNFNQVLCISHLIQIKELFDKKINIVKNNNTSTWQTNQTH